MDSDESGGPVFDWIDISATGAVALSSGDDVLSSDLALGFPFEFYGTTFTTVKAGTNGFLTFDSTATSYTNRSLPSTSGPTNMIAPFWDDIDLNNGGTIYYENVGGDFIVQYDNVMPHTASNSGTGPFTFQVILHPSGHVTMQYLDVSTALASHTIGMQDGTRAIGLGVVYNAAYVHDNLAIRFGTLPEWLTVDVTSGSLAPGASQDVVVTMSAAYMEVGPHNGLLQILSNDPVHPEVQVPVTMMVAIPTPVGDEVLPRTVALDRNVPNPFNPMTEIQFALPRNGPVTLKVFDVRGALVRTLVAETLEAGHHVRVWQGRDDRDQQVPSGVYFYRLEADGKVLTNRMTLVK